jgi:hypothetical protein
MPITAVVVQAIAAQNPNGVSIDTETGRILTGTGFCVAYAATQGQFGAIGAQAALTHATGPAGSGIVGAWRNPADANYYFDSVKKYITREAAVEAAKKEAQIAIYNLNTGNVEDIMVQGAGDPQLPRSPGSFIPAIATGRKRALSV